MTFEEGTHSAWLYDLLVRRVAKLVVCNPRKNALLKAGNKSDTVGNITKNGSSNFNPVYGSGNHVSGFGYDANGDVTNDAANTYAYNVEGRPMTVNGYGQIFDAFDRLVESQNAGGYTSIVYSPDGYKLALMNGSSVVKYMAPVAAEPSATMRLFPMGSGAACVRK